MSYQTIVPNIWFGNMVCPSELLHILWKRIPTSNNSLRIIVKELLESPNIIKMEYPDVFSKSGYERYLLSGFEDDIDDIYAETFTLDIETKYDSISEAIENLKRIHAEIFPRLQILKFQSVLWQRDENAFVGFDLGLEGLNKWQSMPPSARRRKLLSYSNALNRSFNFGSSPHDTNIYFVTDLLG